MPTQPITIPLGPLDARVPDHMAGPGTLREVENLVWLGTPERPVLSPPEGASVAYAPAAGQEVLAAHEMPDGRVIACEPSALSVLTPGSNPLAGAWTREQVYDFGGADATRSMQVAAVAGRYVCAVTCGEGAGEPCGTVILLESGGSLVARPYGEPDLPRLTLQSSVRSADDGFAENKQVMMRLAYAYADGTIGAASTPVLITLGNLQEEGASHQITPTIRFPADESSPVTEPGAYPDVKSVVLFAGYTSDSVRRRASFTEAEPGAFGVPLYEMERYELRDQIGQPIGAAEEAIVASAALIDATLLRHELSAGAAFVYNGRVILGDLCFRLRAPLATDYVLNSASAQDAGAADYAVRMAYVYETDEGEREAVGLPAWVQNAGAASVSLRELIWGVDPRIKRVRIYYKRQGESDYYNLADLPATTVPGAALTLSVSDGPYDLTSAPAGDALAARPDTYRAPGEIVWTESYRLLDLPASNLVRASEQDAVYGFASTAEPASEGQFGQFPILALLSDSIQALGVGSGPFITSRSPLSVRMGAVGRRAWCNVDGGVAVLTRSGAFLIAPRLQARPFSLPLHAQDMGVDFLSGLGPAASIAYLDSPLRDRREVWIASGGRVYVYCLDVGRWCTLTRERSGFVSPSILAYGLDAAGCLVVEDAAASAEQPVALVTAPLLGDLFYKKRVRRFGLRQRPMLSKIIVTLEEPARPEHGFGETRQVAYAEMVAGFDGFSFHTPGAFCYEMRARISGTARPGQTIEGFEVRAEQRQPHDTRD